MKRVAIEDLQNYLNEDFEPKGYLTLFLKQTILKKSRIAFIWNREHVHAHLGIVTTALKSEQNLFVQALNSQIPEFNRITGNNQLVLADPEFENKNVKITNKVYLYTDQVNIDLKKLQQIFIHNHFKLIIEVRRKPFQLPKRLALIIGNATYDQPYISNLNNPIHDANSIRSKLEALSFKVIQANDLTHEMTIKAFEEFANEIGDYSEALFFYAGHGIQFQGRNFIVPTDAYLQTSNNPDYDCISFEYFFEKIGSIDEKSLIMIIDACRENPYLEEWHKEQRPMGLASMDAPSGCFIAFATAPGARALDGPKNSNGLFTQAILRHIDTPKVELEQLFKKVRETVEIEAAKRGKSQTPWDISSLKRPFFFKKSQ